MTTISNKDFEEGRIFTLTLYTNEKLVIELVQELSAKDISIMNEMTSVYHQEDIMKYYPKIFVCLVYNIKNPEIKLDKLLSLKRENEGFYLSDKDYMRCYSLNYLKIDFSSQDSALMSMKRANEED